MEFGEKDSLIFAANTIPLPLTPNHFNNSKFGDNKTIQTGNVSPLMRKEISYPGSSLVLSAISIR